jgi:hypothetical protein
VIGGESVPKSYQRYRSSRVQPIAFRCRRIPLFSTLAASSSNFGGRRLSVHSGQMWRLRGGSWTRPPPPAQRILNSEPVSSCNWSQTVGELDRLIGTPGHGSRQPLYASVKQVVFYYAQCYGSGFKIGFAGTPCPPYFALPPF